MVRHINIVKKLGLKRSGHVVVKALQRLSLAQKYLRNEPLEEIKLEPRKAKIDWRRINLSSISRFVRSYSKPTLREANSEDQRTLASSGQAPYSCKKVHVTFMLIKHDSNSSCFVTRTHCRRVQPVYVDPSPRLGPSGRHKTNSDRT